MRCAKTRDDIGSMNLVIIGPTMARTSTYPVATGPTSPRPAATASPAMMIENSPRATRAVPARSRPGVATLSRRAANHPVPILVRVVISARTSTTGTTGRTADGSVARPNETKKVAANRSRNGHRIARAPVGERSGHGDPDEQRADCGRGAHRLRQAGHEQRQPEQAEQHLLVVGVGEQPRPSRWPCR